MYSFQAKPKPVYHWEFTRKFEDKWALIFLIIVPIIEIIRLSISKYHKQRWTKIYNLISPTINKVTSLIRHSKKRSSSERVSPSETEQEQFTIDITADDTKNDIESGKVKLKSKSKSSTSLNLESLNTYDMFKIISTITMFIDHYGYFGLPGLTRSQNSWFRVIGRTAAPGFFFLAGYTSKRFRMRTWFAALFLYVFTSLIPLHIVHSPWESIMNILLIHCIFYYIPPHRIRNPLIHVLLFCVLQYYRNYASSILNIGYGTLPWMLAIAGDLIKHKHYLGKLWVIFAMISFGYSSNTVFAVNNTHTIAIICECIINGLIMIFFRIIEIPIFNKNHVTRLVRDGLKWVSRTGLVVYCGHLTLYRICQLSYYSGQFNHLIY